MPTHNWLIEQQRCATIPVLSVAAGFISGMLPVPGIARWSQASGAGIAAEIATATSFEDLTFERMVAVGASGILGGVLAYAVRRVS